MFLSWLESVMFKHLLLVIQVLHMGSVGNDTSQLYTSEGGGKSLMVGIDMSSDPPVSGGAGDPRASVWHRRFKH